MSSHLNATFIPHGTVPIRVNARTHPDDGHRYVAIHIGDYDEGELTIQSDVDALVAFVDRLRTEVHNAIAREWYVRTLATEEPSLPPTSEEPAALA